MTKQVVLSKKFKLGEITGHLGISSMLLEQFFDVCVFHYGHLKVTNCILEHHLRGLTDVKPNKLKDVA